MWTNNNKLKVVATARPLRVAYLVDVDDCPHQLLDEIFSEAYSRWGGRRSLIVPASTDGIDPRYEEWLLHFDADVIYSFVALNDQCVLDVNETYAPAHLHKHEGGTGPSSARSFVVQLPIAGLPSVSVLPALAARSGAQSNPRVLCSFWNRRTSAFLGENFGLLHSSFGGPPSEGYSQYILINSEDYDNPHNRKPERATYATTEDQVLDALGTTEGLITLSQLSDSFAPSLTGYGNAQWGTSIVVGDTPSDRILFWNLHHRYGKSYFHEVTALRIPASSVADEAFMSRIWKVLQHRGVRHSGQNDHITLHSISLSEDELDAVAKRIRAASTWIGVSISKHSGHADIVPAFRGHSVIEHNMGGALLDLSARVTAEFQGNRVPVPLVMPWHLKEAMPPSGLRAGNWMIDLTIDRQVDHSPYTNVQHIWRLPRRLRLEHAFAMEREGSRFPNDHFILRVPRSGLISTSINLGISRVSVGTPDDVDAIRLGLCAHHEWPPFERWREPAFHGRSRFALADHSDKGRYLTGVLQLFNSLSEAFSVFMDSYWRDELRRLGAVATEADQQKAEELLRVLRKRIGPRHGPMTFSSEQDLRRLATEALRAGRMLTRELRYVAFDQLHRRWLELVERFLETHPSEGEDDPDDHYRDARRLEQSVQFLCQREILFQGREWRCRSCGNRNWVSVDSLTRSLECSVCSRKEPAPVAGHWQFRINPFVLEAYRDHGTEAVIWALWKLLNSSSQSFYFSPSLKLWLEYPDKRSDDCDVEVDALAVADGALYLVEAKTSAGLTDAEIRQLLLAAERIRPDVLMIASMEGGASLTRSADKLRAGLPSGIELRIEIFDPNEMSRFPDLPT